MSIKIAIITNIIPKYREGFYKELFSRKDLLVHIYCQDKIPKSGLFTIEGYKNITTVNYWSFKGEVLNWQFLPFYKIVKGYDLVFVDGNPRYLSHFVLANLLNLLNKKMVLWTMAHSYNSKPFFEYIRLSWSKLFRNIFVYTDFEVSLLRKKGFRTHNVLEMNNGLDQNNINNVILDWSKDRLENWRKYKQLDNKKVIISCARLTRKNRLDSFLSCFPKIVKDIPDVIWYVIGDGDEKEYLLRKVQELGLQNHVHFLGAIYNEQELAPWFLSATVMVHPSSIGLSLLHAFGYGLPVITNDNRKKHGPEFCALKNNENGLTFMEDDFEDLVKKVKLLLQNNDYSMLLREKAKFTAEHKYNNEVMVKNFLKMTKSAI